ncbi:hypothetical protein HYX10_02400, partial [Candidatus Woesearchaeota archaeon]|nr:hypothetical protein [Candidatus Woesearchaeota archaeon]
NGWNELNTAVSSSDGQYFHYTADSPGLSIYAIAARKLAEPAEFNLTADKPQELNETGKTGVKPSEDAETPLKLIYRVIGITALAAVIMLIAALFLFRKRQR